MVETRLWWFGHVERRPVDVVVRRVDQMEGCQITRGRGRLKKTIRETIKKDLNMVFDRPLRRRLIHVLTPLSGIRLDCCCCSIEHGGSMKRCG
jgi:hypothetical protein